MTKRSERHGVTNVSNTMVRRLAASLLIGLIAFCTFGAKDLFAQTGGASSPQDNRTENTADQNLKSLAHVNPTTLAMELNLSFMNYPGRNGNSLPVGLTYSSKVWRMRNNLTWYYTTLNGHRQYVTEMSPYYAERSAAGWTSTLTVPVIEEKLDLYNQLGNPFSLGGDFAWRESVFNYVSNTTETLGGPSGSCQECNYNYGWCSAACSTCSGYCEDWCMYTGNTGYGCPGYGGTGGGGTSGSPTPPPGGTPTPTPTATQTPWPTPTIYPTPTPPEPVVLEDKMHYIKRVSVRLGDGSVHEFRKSDAPFGYCTGGVNDGPNCGPINYVDNLGVFLAVDGSGMRLERTTEGSTLYSPDGTRHIFAATAQDNHEGATLYPATAILDTNGNKTTFTETIVSGESVRTTTDTLGRRITDFLPKNINGNQVDEGSRNIQLPLLDGETQSFSTKWLHLKPVPCTEILTTNCGETEGALEQPEQPLYFYTSTICYVNYPNADPQYNYPGEIMFPNNGTGLRACNPVIGGAPPVAIRFNPVVLAEVRLPDGTKYKFRYNQYGEISKIIYPTGGSETFTYAVIEGVNGYTEAAYAQTNRGVVERRIYREDGTLEQRWQYSAGITGTYPNSIYKIVTKAPKGNDALGVGLRTEKYLYTDTQARHKFGFDDPRVGMPVEERVYDENNALRSRTINEWIHVGPLPEPSRTPEATAKRDARLKRSVTIQIEGDNALATLSETEYDEAGSTDREYFSHLNAKTKKSYHYAALSASTASDLSLSWTTIAALFPAGKLASVTEIDYAYDPHYKARGIIGLPTETRMMDPADPSNLSKMLGKTQTIYDNALPAASSGYPYSMEEYRGVEGNLDCSSTPEPAICWENPNGPMEPINLSYRGLPTATRTWHKEESTWIEVYLGYDPFGNVLKTQDPIGNETVTQYASGYNYAYPTSVITSGPDPSNTHGTSETSTAGSSYDFTTGLLLSITNDFGQVTTTEYDSSLRPVRINPVVVNGVATGPITETEHGVPNQTTGQFPAGERFTKVRKQLDAANWDEVVTYTDSLGRSIRTIATDTQGAVNVQTTYDRLGRKQMATNPYREGEPIFWNLTEFDEMGRLKQTREPVEGQTPLSPTGNILGTQSYSISGVASYIGTVLTATDASGRRTRTITNALGQVLRVDEPTTISTNAETDLGSLVSPTQPTSYTYNASGKMIKVQQEAQDRYFMYDSLGRLVRVRQPEQEVNTSLKTTGNPDNNNWTAGFSYDVAGNVLTSTDARGIEITNTYDRAKRLKTRTYSDDTPDVSYFYDGRGLPAMQSPINWGKGKLTKVTSTVSATQNTTFDSFGRLTETQQITDGQTFTSKYTYNLSGALVEEEYPSGRKVKAEFESDGDLSRLTSKKGGTQVYRPYLSNLAYTASGGISQLKLGNGKWETTKFNSRLQIEELALGSSRSDTGLWKVNYHYGELESNGEVGTSKNTGNIAKQVLTIPGASFAQRYKYDPLYRLTEAKETTAEGDSWLHTYDYDRYGNRTSFSQQFGEFAEIILPALAIDPLTNRFEEGQGFVYDDNGNVVRDVDPVTGHIREFLFNGDNKQVQVKDVDNSNQVTGTYYYDGSGHRVKKVTDAETTIFVYSAGKLVAEYSTDPPDEPAINYTTADHLGTPRVITNPTGQVVSRRDFMPFGEEIAASIGGRSANPDYTPSGDAVRQKFTGYQKDLETSLDFAEARMYDNRLGRFTAVDPLLASGKSANPQTFNRYIYTSNNPILRVDRNGLDWYITFTKEKGREAYHAIPRWCNDDTLGCAGHKWGTTGTFHVNGKPWNWDTRAYAFKDSLHKGYVAIDFYENRIAGGLSSIGEAQSLVEKWNRQAQINFIAGALSAYSLGFEFSGVAEGVAETKSRMFAMGQRAGTGAAIAGSVTGVGALNGLVNRFGSGALAVIKEFRLTRSTTVLGKSGTYEKVAEALGANYLRMSDEAWAGLTDAEKWSKNQAFLDQAIQRGDDIVLASKGTKATGFFKREIDYMISQGYRLSEDGTRLLRPQ